MAGIDPLKNHPLPVAPPAPKTPTPKAAESTKQPVQPTKTVKVDQPVHRAPKVTQVSAKPKIQHAKSVTPHLPVAPKIQPETPKTAPKAVSHSPKAEPVKHKINVVG